MTRMRRLLALDPVSQLATFEAGVAGPDLEAQLRAQNFVLGHYPQSFEYSTLGGWIATRSCGQQSARYGRIEALFAGGRIETPAGRARPAGLSRLGRRTRPARMGARVRGTDRDHHARDGPRVASAGARNLRRIFSAQLGGGSGRDARARSGADGCVDGEALQPGRDRGDAAALGRRRGGRGARTLSRPGAAAATARFSSWSATQAARRSSTPSARGPRPPLRRRGAVSTGALIGSKWRAQPLQERLSPQCALVGRLRRRHDGDRGRLDADGRHDPRHRGGGTRCAGAIWRAMPRADPSLAGLPAGIERLFDLRVPRRPGLRDEPRAAGAR